VIRFYCVDLRAEKIAGLAERHYVPVFIRNFIPRLVVEIFTWSNDLPENKPKILVVDDEQGILDALKKVFEKEGLRVATAQDGEDALCLIEIERPDLIFLDISMPGMSGLEALQEIKKRKRHLPVVAMTGHGTMQTAIEAVKFGAYDYISKPLRRDKILLIANRALEMARSHKEANRLHRKPQKATVEHELVGSHAKMQEVYKKIGVVCTTPNTANVLIFGESGTGKELVARAIHKNAPNPQAPFQAINSTVLTESLLESELFGHEKGAFTGADRRKLGKFEVAGDGTILLDEIGDMPETLQKKLLRVIQERAFERLGSNGPIPLHARIIAATHHDLAEAVRKKHFREDLFYRLNVLEVNLPPLREREGDIEILANHFLEKYNRRFGKEIAGITPEVFEELHRYGFPGNVRELENLIARAVTHESGNFLTPESFPPKLFPQKRPQAIDVPILHSDFSRSRQAVIEAFEKKFLVERLGATHGNVSEAARQSGLERQSFQRLMKKYGLASEDFRRG
jgi:DNA-binding NtrC family response regulator